MQQKGRWVHVSRLLHNCFHYCRLLKKHLFCYKWQSAVFYKRLFLLFKSCDTDSVFLPHTWIATGLVCFAIDWIFWQYKGQSRSGHLYSPLPYACVYTICHLEWQHTMHFLFSLGAKRNTKFHGAAGVQLGRLPIVGFNWANHSLQGEWLFKPHIKQLNCSRSK